MADKPINIGILGFGNVGVGTFRTLEENKRSIALKIGRPLKVKLVADVDWKRPRPLAVLLADKQKTGDALAVVDDPDIQIVVECIGGLKPAEELILRALRNGKNVVTSNKELIAKRGHKLLDEADKRKLDICFEGAVCGGIPIIRSLKESLTGNHICRVMGIVNGTTNYILTRMTQEGSSFKDALADAQAKGCAEPDPTSDIEGFDATYKLGILAAIAFESRVKVAEIYREGISGVGAADITYARQLGYVIKLLAIGVNSPDGLELRVQPVFLTKEHPLTSVNGVFNAVWVQGSSVGEVMFYGQGAGPLPTGSAVVGDIIEVARNIQHNATGRLPCTCFAEKRIKKIEEIETKYYIRVGVLDRPGVLGKIATIFGEEGVSLASVIQQNQASGEAAEIVWITHRVMEKNIRVALARLRRLREVNKINSWMRVEE
jgi:homoserine dehydrogenase